MSIARTLTEPRDAVALSILQSYLDASTKLVLVGDVDAYADHIVLPYVYRTGAGQLINETEEDLAHDIREIHDWLRSLGATDFHRIARQADFVSDDVIEGSYVSYALRGAQPLIEPFSSRMILRRTDTRWRGAASEHELTAPIFASAVARPAPGLLRSAWNTGFGLATRDHAQALPIYQAVLDAMDAAQNARDFDGWCDLFTLPHDIHYDIADHRAESRADGRPFYDIFVEAMTEARADQSIRRAGSASFISDDRLLGYHDTVIARDGAVRLGPVKCRMILVLSEGTWTCSSVSKSLSDNSFSDSVFQPSESLATMRQIQGRMSK